MSLEAVVQVEIANLNLKWGDLLAIKIPGNQPMLEREELEALADLLPFGIGAIITHGGTEVVKVEPDDGDHTEAILRDLSLYGVVI